MLVCKGGTNLYSKSVALLVLRPVLRCDMRNCLKNIGELRLNPPCGVLSAILFAVALSGPFLSPSALGATDGDLGITSEGSIGIAVIIPPLVKISNLDDVNFGTWNGTQSLSNEDQVCVWSSSRAYSLTGMGGEGGNFVMRSESGDEIPYTVEWTPPSGGALTLTSGQAQPNLSSPATDIGCADETSMALMSVGIAQEDLAAAPAGDYNGILMLTVSSE